MPHQAPDPIKLTPPDHIDACICDVLNALIAASFQVEHICRQLAQEKAAQRTQEEEAAALRVTEIIKAKVDEVMASEATQQRIQRRLKEERASLEDKVILSSGPGSLPTG